jgi:ankyrin repeat protein
LWGCNHTALHITAERGAVELARILLDAGADPSIRDDKYEATVLGWADYCGQPQIAELLQLRGVTT